MYDYQLPDGTPIFSVDSDVADFATPQMAPSFDPSASPHATSVTPATSASSMPSPSMLFPLSPSFVPAFEELGLITSSPEMEVDETRVPSADADKSTACPICGNEAGRHVHYGGRACTSCRAFFRRSVQVRVSKYCRTAFSVCLSI
jgi:Zinc finger, C4 type (two domains)